MLHYNLHTPNFGKYYAYVGECCAFLWLGVHMVRSFIRVMTVYGVMLGLFSAKFYAFRIGKLYTDWYFPCFTAICLYTFASWIELLTLHLH